MHILIIFFNKKFMKNLKILIFSREQTRSLHYYVRYKLIDDEKINVMNNLRQ